jgi:PAS domain-containing protein
LPSNNVLPPLSECRELTKCGRGTPMSDSIERAIAPEPVHRAWLLEQAVNNLSLGLIICDKKYEVVFCNKRYMEIYGLSSEQVKPGTPIRELIQHRFNLGFKAFKAR